MKGLWFRVQGLEFQGFRVRRQSPKPPDHGVHAEPSTQVSPQTDPATPQFPSNLTKAIQTLSQPNPGPGGHRHQTIQAKNLWSRGGGAY